MEKRPRVRDIALAAGVSTATVDRVLHGRGGVAADKAERVEAAIARLAGRCRSNAATNQRLIAILPAEAGPSTDFLAGVLAREAERRGARIVVQSVPKLDPGALAAAIDAIDATAFDGLALMPLEHGSVRHALDDATRRGLRVVSLLTGIAGPRIAAHIATDNRAAGRTAGWLMGRFAPAHGRIVVLWSGQLYRSHEERELGFRSLLRQEFPGLHLVERVGGDVDHGNEAALLELLSEVPDVVGIYNVGGGNGGIANALHKSGRAQETIFIGHNLTAQTQQLLLDGTMDAVVHQDMDLAGRTTIDALMVTRPVVTTSPARADRDPRKSPDRSLERQVCIGGDVRLCSRRN